MEMRGEVTPISAVKVATGGMECPTSKITLEPYDIYTVKVTYKNEGITSGNIQIIAFLVYNEEPLYITVDSEVYYIGTLSEGFAPVSVGEQETVTLKTGVHNFCNPGHPIIYKDCGLHVFVLPYDKSQNLGVFHWHEPAHGFVSRILAADIMYTLSQAGAYAAGYCDAIIDWKEPQC
ncbi:hypothetical protein DRO49_04495 [Candidatus Bathyarchaeota archaeon]|nr:MAG: hypothetical protein DRO49_04495 [Candidatus Bathyarchaeota archaeon]